MVAGLAPVPDQIKSTSLMAGTVTAFSLYAGVMVG
jgi:hypothetical protein